MGAWHYVVYQTGEEELCDLANDPWELENLASAAEFSEIRDQLASRLSQHVP